MPWALLRLGGLVVPVWRELAEMRYLWTCPHALDGAAAQRFAGPLPTTRLAQALAPSVRALFPSPGHAPAAGPRPTIA